MGNSNMLLFLFIFFHLGLIVQENPVYSVISKWRKALSWALWLVNFRIRSLVLKEIGHWCLQQLIWTDERWIFGCFIVLLDEVGSYLYVGVFFSFALGRNKKKGVTILSSLSLWELFYGWIFWLELKAWRAVAEWKSLFFPMSGFSARHLSSCVNPLPVDCHD